MIKIVRITLAINLLFFFENSFSQVEIKHFIFFSREREKIHDSAFFSNPGVVGAQITYPWKRLEPQKDKYDFTEVEADLKFLETKGKKLFIQLQDVTFDSTLNVLPKYILKDSAYHGGANADYQMVNGKLLNGGWVSRRWDSAVAHRWHCLIKALGKQFDGRAEGMNLPESSLAIGENGSPLPPGFTYEKYRDAIMENMKTLKEAFPQSKPIQYANFMPSGKYLKDLYKYAEEIKVGMGGPDIKVYRAAQMDNSYPLIRDVSGIVVTGVAVQEGNYDIKNIKTGKRVTVREILSFATNYLKLNYIFWCTEEPYYSSEVLPLLGSLKK